MCCAASFSICCNSACHCFSQDVCATEPFNTAVMLSNFMIKDIMAKANVRSKLHWYGFTSDLLADCNCVTVVTPYFVAGICSTP